VREENQIEPPSPKSEKYVALPTAPAKRGPAPKLQQQIERIQKLPKSRQRFVMEMLDTVLAQQSR
jgi:hypothetical protein